MTKKVRRAVLAYSGGLDTSIIVPWLRERYGCEVICYCSNVGQGDELAGLEKKAKAIGAYVSRTLRASGWSASRWR